LDAAVSIIPQVELSKISDMKKPHRIATAENNGLRKVKLKRLSLSG
jgi:hypothetical protein